MARKKDLNSLAALAGMACLASRGKAKGGEDSAPVAEDTGATASPVRSGEVEETKLDSMSDMPRARPTAPRAAAPASPGAGGGRGRMGGPTAEQASSNAGLESKKPAYETPYDRSRREDREAGRDIGSVVEGLKNRIATAGERGSVLPLKSTKSDKNDFMGAGMKKGGSVKGWGIARGARKAKTY
jgi:hypothetical protein